MNAADYVDDPALVALVEAARVVVDNGRSGPTCNYQWKPPHKLGSNGHCALCSLARALAAYDAEAECPPD